MLDKLKPYFNRFRLTTYNERGPVNRVMFGDNEFEQYQNLKQAPTLKDSVESNNNYDDKGSKSTKDSVLSIRHKNEKSGEEVTPLKQRPQGIANSLNNDANKNMSGFPSNLKNGKRRLVTAYKKSKGKAFSKLKRISGTSHSSNNTVYNNAGYQNQSNLNTKINNQTSLQNFHNPYIK